MWVSGHVALLFGSNGHFLGMTYGDALSIISSLRTLGQLRGYENIRFDVISRKHGKIAWGILGENTQTSSTVANL